MDYVIGIDSGGTNYRVMAGDLQGNQLGTYTGCPANHYYVEKEEILRRINHSIDQCLEQFEGKREDCRYIVCGSTGLDSAEDDQILQEIYHAIPGFSCPIKIINDAELAHYTVTGGQGVLVISGTGSIGFGSDRAGRTARAGGCMFSILGDEGSGTWVTKRTLRHLARWFDGAVPTSPLVQLSREALKLETRSQLNSLALEMGTPPWHTPQLGEIVNKAAVQGDEAAVQILQEAAAEVFHIAEDVACALELERAEPDFTIGVWGSNIVKSTIVFEQFCRLAKERYPQATVALPKDSATEGAVKMARELLEKGVLNPGSGWNTSVER